MAHHDVSHETLPPSYLAGRGYALALLLSRVFHPILLNVAMFVIVGYYAQTTSWEGMKWALACIVAQVVPPTLFFTYRLRQGAYSDEDVSRRQQRNELYVFGLMTVLGGIALLLPLGLPRAFMALLLCALIVGVVCATINLAWKISVHAASIASTATVALLFSQTLGIILWICAVAVGWARVRTRNHTPLQVLAGFVVAAIVVATVFQVVG